MKHAKMSILFLLTIFLIPIFHLTVFGQKTGAARGLRQASARSSGPEVCSSEMKKVGALRFDKFKALDSDSEKTRLDYFLSELKRDSTLSGYIIVYGKRDAPESEAKKRAENAKNYLQYERQAKNPLVTIDWGTPRAAVEYELWIVREGKKPFLCLERR